MHSRQLPKSSALALTCLPVQSWSSPARFHPSLIWPWLPREPSPGALRLRLRPPLWSLKLLLEWPCSQVQLPGRSFPRPKGSHCFSPTAASPVYFSLVVTCMGTVWPLPLSSSRISVASLSYLLIVTQVSGRTVAAVALAVLGMRSAHLLHSPGCGFPTASPSPAEQALWEP